MWFHTHRINFTINCHYTIKIITSNALERDLKVSIANERQQIQCYEHHEATRSEADAASNTGTNRNEDGEHDEGSETTIESVTRKDGFTADYLYRCCDKSFQMELDRYQSLTATATKLITCISIIAVAIMTAAGILAPAFSNIGASRQLALYCLIVFVPLIGSLVTALCSQFRFRYKALSYPSEIANTVNKFDSDFSSAKEAAIHYANTIEPCFESLRNRNETIRLLLKASTVCLIATLGLIVLFSVLGCGILL